MEVREQSAERRAQRWEARLTEEEQRQRVGEQRALDGARCAQQRSTVTTWPRMRAVVSPAREEGEGEGEGEGAVHEERRQQRHGQADDHQRGAALRTGPAEAMGQVVHPGCLHARMGEGGQQIRQGAYEQTLGAPQHHQRSQGTGAQERRGSTAYGSPARSER